MPAQRTDIHGAAGPAFGVLQVEAGAERLGAAGEHHDRRFAVVLKTARGVGELTQRLGRQRVDSVVTVEPHHSDAPLGPEPLFYPYEVRQCPRSLPVVSCNDTSQTSSNVSKTLSPFLDAMDHKCPGREQFRPAIAETGAFQKKISVVYLSRVAVRLVRERRHFAAQFEPRNKE